MLQENCVRTEAKIAAKTAKHLLFSFTAHLIVCTETRFLIRKPINIVGKIL